MGSVDVTRRRPVQHERVEQAHGVEALKRLGAKVAVYGTTRKKNCWQCRAPSRDMSTRQTPGVPDVMFTLPRPGYRPIKPHGRLGFWEVKSATGRASPEQLEWRDAILDAGGEHVLGTLQALTAFLIEGGWVRVGDVPHYRLPTEAN